MKGLSAVPLFAVCEFIVSRQENADPCSSLNRRESTFPTAAECVITFFSAGFLKAIGMSV